MTARRTRRRSAAFAALALGLAGSLALTGCNSSSSKSRKSSSSSSSKSKKRTVIGGGAAAAGAGAGAAAGSRTRVCPFSTTWLSFSQTSGAKGYVTVRYRNASSTSCTLYDGPLLYFNKAKSPLPLMKEEGGHVLTLKPKSAAYAIIPTTTPAARGTEQKQVGVQFVGRHAGARTPDQPAVYDLAKKYSTVSVGQSRVTYWYDLPATARMQAGVGN
ncbi:DUF4232 domain-containing protein [Streptomyces sp. RS10V-4]|uniref:DUF4232 domain-containing protein n=1 Tax=Streptomyces rhizoryzae TaxID=2932493 RepID=UPI002003CC6B|nr:DUF4232 domain-containing protein [Streptomyces rhizoryzae]MCK7623836.1 DUF4232 domain-containing protein [Streptomyces rhizoryzae]